MEEKPRQKKALIVGMLIKILDLPLIAFKANETFCQAPALAE